MNKNERANIPHTHGFLMDFISQHQQLSLRLLCRVSGVLATFQ